MKTVLIIGASLLLSFFTALFQPNEYGWMRDEYGAGQLPEDADMMFKMATVLVIHGLIQIVLLLLLFRSGRKVPASLLAAIAVASAAILALRS